MYFQLQPVNLARGLTKSFHILNGNVGVFNQQKGTLRLWNDLDVGKRNFSEVASLNNNFRHENVCKLTMFTVRILETFRIECSVF